MKRSPMFLMLLLATALADSSANPARGAKAKSSLDLAGPSLPGEDERAALDAAHRASARRIKPAA